MVVIWMRGFISSIFCSSINTCLWCNACTYRASQQSMCFPLWHGLSKCSVFSFVPYLCLFSRICAAYAEVELLDLIYLICSLNLKPIALPDCPTYTLLHVLHFNLYIPLGSFWMCLAVFSCCCIVLVARKLIFISVCLKKEHSVQLASPHSTHYRHTKE
jgi:hypothetical protein